MTNQYVNKDEIHFKKFELVNMVGDNEEFINVLLNTFTEGYHKYIKRIHLAIIENDEEEFKINVHSITESAKSVCFTIMAQLTDELEFTKLSDNEKIKDLIDEIENEFEIISEIINR